MIYQANKGFYIVVIICQNCVDLITKIKTNHQEKTRRTNNMTTNKLEEILTNVIAEEKEDFLSNLLNYKDTTFELGDGTRLSCMKLSEKVINRKKKFVQTELVFLSFGEDGIEFHGIMTVDSAVNSLTATKIRFANYRNISFRTCSAEDNLQFFMALKFFEKYENYNNLLGLAVKIHK